MTGPSTFQRSRSLFLRLFGLISLCAFVSAWIQIDGLVGSHGILPIADFLRHASAARYWSRFPTLCWVSQSDAFLHALCGAGTLVSLLLFLDFAPALCAFLIWVFYLSITKAGRDFFSFQWDILFVETALLSVFYAPWRLGRGRGADPPPPRLARLLVWWLAFRLMFESGVVKWTANDPTWHDLTALAYHYETQPLPHVGGWLAFHFPLWFQKASTAGVFLIEVGFPLLIFLPWRRVRHVGACGMAFLQLLILATGNYGCFNLLALALCFSLLDDRALPPWRTEVSAPQGSFKDNRIKRILLVPFAACVLFLSGLHVVGLFAGPGFEGTFCRKLEDRARPFLSVNAYGLFRVMTTHRDEIDVQGSDDGVHWKSYGFRFKPGDVKKPPLFCVPHMPRLDWQMWFAALPYQPIPNWFKRFVVRLLQGEPAVLRLLQKDPFPGHPPEYVRAIAWRYRFTTFAEHERTGAWWKRDEPWTYLPPVSLRTLR